MPRVLLRHRAWLFAAFALTFLHVVLTNYFLPLRAVFSDRPVTGDDFDLHIGQVYKVVEGLERWGHSWIYDVSLVAGQPEGTIMDSGSKAWELWAFAWHRLGVPLPIAFNTWVLLTMLASPLVLFAAARVFGLDRGAALIAAAMTSSLWFFDSNLHWMWFIGMVSWAFAAALSVLTLALFLRFLAGASLRWAAVTAASLGFNLLVHPYAFFVLAPPLAFCYLRRLRALPVRAHLGVLGMVVTALAMNAYWLITAARHWHYILDSAYYAQSDLLYAVCDWAELLCDGTDTGLIGTRTGFRFLYLSLAVVGLGLLRRARDERFAPLVLTIGVLFAWAYLSNYLPGMQQTQPYRQIIPAMLMSVLPAALAVQWIVEHASRRTLPPVAQVMLVVSALAVTQHLVVEVLYFVPRLLPEPRRLIDGSRSHISKYGFLRPHGPDDLQFGVPRDRMLELGMDELMNELVRVARPGARVVVEGSVLGERLAWKHGFEVLGGFVERNLAHVFANYYRTYQERAAKPEELAHYLRLYAVEWVVGNRPEFAEAPELLEPVTIAGGRNIYRSRVAANRVLHGGGTVHATTNRIEVRDSDPQRPVALAYHWHEALRCKPDCSVERMIIAPDRVGLLKVPVPHPVTFVIWNSYQGY